MIGEQLITAHPCVGASRVQPMTIDEIDAHPDAARIWATIIALRDAFEDDEDTDRIEDLERELDEERGIPRADALRESLRETLFANDAPFDFATAEKMAKLIDEAVDAL